MRRVLFWLPAPLFGVAVLALGRQVALTAVTLALLEASPRTHQLVPEGASSDLVALPLLVFEGAGFGLLFGAVVAVVDLLVSRLRWRRLGAWLLVYPLTFTLAGMTLGPLLHLHLRPVALGGLLPTGIAAAGLFLISRAAQRRAPLD